MSETTLASTPPFAYSSASAAVPSDKLVDRYEATSTLLKSASLPKAKAGAMAKVVSVTKKAMTTVVYDNGLVTSWY